jgi:hypothetical protein
MNEDYLWDKSGEPDPQIQQLEEILGTLRYQPKPLKLPAGLPTTRRRNYFPLAAIAATILIAVLSTAVWFQIEKSDATIPVVAIASEPTASPIINPPLSPSTKPPTRRKQVFVRHDTQEALAAKQQLMFALRLASEKLNSAYRRTQAPTQIKNQHKAG